MINYRTLSATLCGVVLLIFLSCNTADSVKAAAGSNGEQAYLANCVKCHGRNGDGFLAIYPPLEKSRYFDSKLEKLPCIIRYGLKGELVIDGRLFNGIMPGNSRISEEQISELIDYLLVRWGEGGADLRVASWLQKCSGSK